MLLIINIKYFAVEEQLPVMLLISVIKYLIVMPDVKDLAQAAQGAAVAPGNVNVVNKLQVLNKLMPQRLNKLQRLNKFRLLKLLSSLFVLTVIVM